MVDEIKKKLVSGKSLVVFLHGIATSGDDWECLLNILCRDRYQFVRWNKSGTYTIHKHSAYSISYFTGHLYDDYFHASIDLYSERTVDIIRSLPQKRKIVFIAHSMGGLVIKNILLKHTDILQRTKKVLTIGSPNLGVPITLPYPTVLRQLYGRGTYIKNLNNLWYSTEFVKQKRWGVIGGISNSYINRLMPDSLKTDSAGPGFITVKSSIPLDWKFCKLDEQHMNSNIYGYCSMVRVAHQELLCCHQILPGIQWALQS